MFAATVVLSLALFALRGRATALPALALAATGLVAVGFAAEGVSVARSSSGDERDRGLQSSAAACVVILAVMAWRYFDLRPLLSGRAWAYAFGPGALSFAAGVALRHLARRSLGRDFSYSVRINPDHALAASGPYAIVRHPAYLGTLLVMAGVTGLFGAPAGFALIVVFAPMTIRRMRAEEALLVRRFGGEYRRYQRRVKRIIPHVW